MSEIFGYYNLEWITVPSETHFKISPNIDTLKRCLKIYLFT